MSKQQSLQLRDSFDTDTGTAAADNVLLVDSKDETDVTAKVHCASTILQWSYRDINASRLVSEGAVEVVLTMCKTPDIRVKAYCSAVLKYFANTPLLRARLIARSAVQTVSELAVADAMLKKNCMAALVALTCSDAAAATTLSNSSRSTSSNSNSSSSSSDEAKIVEDSIVSAMTTIATSGNLASSTGCSLTDLCAQGLFNLTCVSAPYAHLERVVKALVNIAAVNSGSSSASSSGTPSAAAVATTAQTQARLRLVCAKALCNITALSSMHARVIEDGCISVLSTIIKQTRHDLAAGCAAAITTISEHGDTDASKTIGKTTTTITSGNTASSLLIETERTCAQMLHRLTISDHERSNMIVKGAVGVLVTLSSSSSDVLTLQHIASALLRLSNDHSSRARLLQEGAMVAVCNVATACHAVTTTSSNSHSSASSDATALRYITRVCATALNILARADTSTTS
eukprot:7417-Heterococcus_DN1.PRE.1